MLATTTDASRTWRRQGQRRKPATIMLAHPTALRMISAGPAVPGRRVDETIDSFGRAAGRQAAPFG
jgi:hypothetical protein